MRKAVCHTSIWPVLLLLLLFPCSALQLFSLDSRLMEVKDFLYLLQADHVSIQEFSDNDFDLIVMDYAQYGDEDSEYSSQEIQRIKTGRESGSPKVVLAYLSIGEAEDYRFYWADAWEQNPPAWLGPHNPDWPGNYKVRYWMGGWKDILFGNPSPPLKSYLDRIIDQGFDGVYLDIIDAYEYWSGPEGNQERTRAQARADMKNLLLEMRQYARTARGREGFLVFPQNAAGIILDDQGQLDALGHMYLEQCDGIGQEEIWYQGQEQTDGEDRDWITHVLDLFKENGKLVLSVEYIWDSSSPRTSRNINRFNAIYQKSRQKEYIPYAADLNLELNNIITVRKGDGFLFSQPVPNRKKGPVRR